MPMPPTSTITILPLDDVRLPTDEGDWLGDAERIRLAGLSSPLRRRQFLAGHWLARRAAAEWLGDEPGHWDWRPEGSRPALVRRRDGQACRASIAHCGEWLAVALSQDPIGVDIEATRVGQDWVARAGRLLSPPEAAAVARATDPGLAFLRFWTLKEAEGKRAGTGLLPRRARRFEAVPAAENDAEAWCWVRGELTVAVAMPPGSVPPAGLVPRPPGFRFRALDPAAG